MPAAPTSPTALRPLDPDRSPPAGFDLDLQTEPTTPQFDVDAHRARALFDVDEARRDPERLDESTDEPLDHLVDSPDMEPEVRLPAYEAFSAQGVSVDLSSPTSALDLVRAILEAEGPATGFRLHEVVAQVVGSTRLTKLQSRQLNSAIFDAVRVGVLTEDNPLGDEGVRPATYRLPDQPKVLARTLGPRALEHVPPDELSLVIREYVDRSLPEEEIPVAVQRAMGGDGPISQRAHARLTAIHRNLTNLLVG